MADIEFIPYQGTHACADIDTAITKAGTALQPADVTSTYSATGTAAVNGTAVADAISGKADTADLTPITEDIEDLDERVTALEEGGGGGGGTSNYNQLSNKPQINGVTLSGNKSTADLGITENVQADWSETDSTDGSFIKNKPTIPAAQVNADWNAQSGVSEILNKPTIPTVNNAALEIQKNGTKIGEFTANAASDVVVNLSVPVTAADVDALPDTTKYGASFTMSINSSTYVVTATLKDQDGNTLGTAQTIDLPLESVVVGGSYDSQTKKVILTLQSGSTIEFSVADLVSGLQSEISALNPLDADFVDDSNSTHKFVTAAEKTTWNGKQDALVVGTNLDNTPTQGSTNPITSGGVYSVIGDINSVIEGVL